MENGSVSASAAVCEAQKETQERDLDIRQATAGPYLCLDT